MILLFHSRNVEVVKYLAFSHAAEAVIHIWCDLLCKYLGKVCTYICEYEKKFSINNIIPTSTWEPQL